MRAASPGRMSAQGATELRFEYPFTTEIAVDDPRYLAEMGAFYEATASAIAQRLDAGQDVALLCEGDPFFYGSAMYLFDRLGSSHRNEIVPGITGMSGCWTRARLPFTHGDDVLTVLPGTLDEASLAERLTQCDAAVIMKVGRNLPKIRAALHSAGLDGSRHLCRARHDAGRAHREAVRHGRGDRAVFLDGAGARAAAAAMSGKLFLVGLGPGDPGMRTPQADAALSLATDLVGYGPYLDRVPDRAGLVRHASDNREEISRARHALALAQAGRRVAVVSSGDAGVFAMASAVFEAIEHGPAEWRGLDVEIVPGISAMFAVAARIGAPLGHDFCAISLSDNLKPWEVVVQRLTAAAGAGFVLALYNPISRARPWQLGAAFTLLRGILPPATPVVFATAVSRAEEAIDIVPLADADPARADMRTLVLVGTAATRRIERPGGAPWIYTPRGLDAA